MYLGLWITAILSPYLWFCAFRGMWENVIRYKFFSRKLVIIFNALLVNFIASLDFQDFSRFILQRTTEFTFWERPRASPTAGAGLPSGHSMAAGALVSLHPHLFPYSIAVMLARVLMQYHTPFQCAVGYFIGGTLTTQIRKVLKKREYFPILILSFAFRIGIRHELVPPILLFVPLILTWIPVIVQVTEP
eukprot:TRINITY_DN1924_c0_g1_i4.p1 TRINITY_DN1924_c0_g1~~TRINITY_DN1924_c0_g1_i4.p1  ORF type:complete len:190 (-),score=33.23 TRINITY_DN1924_c0_g1_i4:196-765(-)